MARNENLFLLIVAVVGVAAVFSVYDSGITGMVSFEERLSQVEQSIASLSQELSAGESKVIELQSKLESAKAQESSLASGVSNKKQEVVTVKESALALRAKAIGMIEQLKVIDDENVFIDLLLQTKEVIKEFRLSRDEFNVKKQEYLTLKLDFEAIQANIISAQAELDAVSQIIAPLSEKMAQLKAQKLSLEQAIMLENDVSGDDISGDAGSGDGTVIDKTECNTDKDCVTVPLKCVASIDFYCEPRCENNKCTVKTGLIPDSDSDGVRDNRDKCPDTLAGTKVDLVGCVSSNCVCPKTPCVVGKHCPNYQCVNNECVDVSQQPSPSCKEKCDGSVVYLSCDDGAVSKGYVKGKCGVDKEIALLQAQLDSITQGIANGNKKMSGLQKQLNEYNKDYGVLKQSIGVVDKDVSSFTARIGLSKKRMADLEKGGLLNNEKAEFIKLEKQIKSDGVVLSALNNQRKELNSQLTAVGVKREKTSSEISKLKTGIAELNSQYAQINKKLLNILNNLKEKL
ncbi:hypothetical protein HY486_02925 [Candidatus Woesearchaeota archaeon]|nr:hypothetical protein [Candidatus Woesearchaeota archaeon]